MMRDDAAARCCKYGFIGVGNMASALIAGLIDTGAVKPDNIMVFDIDASRCTPFTARGAYAAESAAEVCGSCAYSSSSVPSIMSGSAVPSLSIIPSGREIMPLA